MPKRRRALEAGKKLCFDIGKHLVRLALCAEGWSASVDGLALEGRYSNQAQAWEVGVRVALQLEGPLSAPATPSAPGAPSSPATPSTPDAPGDPGQDEQDDEHEEPDAPHRRRLARERRA
jgi:hypothetical protein